MSKQGMGIHPRRALGSLSEFFPDIAGLSVGLPTEKRTRQMQEKHYVTIAAKLRSER